MPGDGGTGDVWYGMGTTRAPLGVANPAAFGGADSDGLGSRSTGVKAVGRLCVVMGAVSLSLAPDS